MTSASTEPRKHRSSNRIGRLIGALGLAFLPLVVVLVRGNPSPAPTPAPTPEPTPIVIIDSGFHKAIDAHGSQYQIDNSYYSMSDGERGDANRYAHLHPGGS